MAWGFWDTLKSCFSTNIEKKNPAPVYYVMRGVYYYSGFRSGKI
jgi:hypothetical protein